MERDVSQERSHAARAETRRSRALITQETYDRLLIEREILKPRLVEATRAVADSRISDDNSEHSERQAALDRVGEITSRLMVIGNIVDNPLIISPRQQTDTVRRGNTAKVRFEAEDGKSEEFHITLVGSEEDKQTRPGDWFPMDSPFGKAINGKREGDRFTVTVVDKRRDRPTVSNYTVLEISPGIFTPPRGIPKPESS